MSHGPFWPNGSRCPDSVPFIPSRHRRIFMHKNNSFETSLNSRGNRNLISQTHEVREIGESGADGTDIQRNPYLTSPFHSRCLSRSIMDPEISVKVATV